MNADTQLGSSLQRAVEYLFRHRQGEPMAGEGAGQGKDDKHGGRGGPRPGSGRPPLPDSLRRRRMSIGFTQPNLQWLRSTAQEQGLPMAVVVNKLIEDARLPDAEPEEVEPELVGQL